jgi:hypothetical protein
LILLCWTEFVAIFMTLSLSHKRGIVIPDLQAKPSTHRMCAQNHLFHTHGHKLFTDSQMSQISIFIT